MVVASDKEAHEGAQFFDMARETAPSTNQRRHVAAQVGIGALDGVGFCFSRCDIVACRASALTIDQLVIGGEAVAIELMHCGH